MTKPCDDHEPKQITIIINGRKYEVPKEEISFEEIVDLAFDDASQGENICFTITFKRGRGDKPEGTLVEGDAVKVKKGMIFNVTRTDKS